MYNQGNQQNPPQGDKNNNSIFDVVDNDFFVNFLFEQPPQQQQSIPRTYSNPQFFNQNFQQFHLNGNQFNPLFNERQQQIDCGSLDQQLYQQQILSHENMKEEFLAQHLPLPPNNEVQQPFQKQKNKKKNISPSQPQNLQMVQDETGLLKSNTELFTYKNNLKNTYINKISSLISQENIQQPSKNSRSQKKQQNKLQKNEDEIERKESYQKLDTPSINYDNIIQLESNQAKLVRNRECARNSRKRKKIYIELLENKVKGLSEELEKTKKILKTSTSYLSKMSQNQQLQGFFLGRQQLFEKLDKVVQSEADPNEINLLLDSMRFRVGGGGKERVNAGNYFFNQILDICFPIHVRYLLWSSSQSNYANKSKQFKIDRDLFLDLNESNDIQVDQNIAWTAALQQQLNITENQRKHVQKYKKKLIAEKDKISDLLKTFSEIKDQIYQRTAQVENFVDELRNILSPLQVSKFLIGLEQNKYRKEMVISKIWDVLDNGSDFEFDIKEETPGQQEPMKKVHL